MAFINCLSCGRNEERQASALFCFECSKQRSAEQARAIHAVGSAVRKGSLPPPTDFDCADCERKAEQYDHRDYTKPLAVEPVCVSCNIRRGPALDSQMRGIPDCYAQPA